MPTTVGKLKYTEQSVDKDGWTTGSLTNGSLSFLVEIQNGTNNLKSSLMVYSENHLTCAL